MNLFVIVFFCRTTYVRMLQIDIFVKLMGTVALKVKRSETTKELKAMLCEKYGIPENRQQLFFESYMLMDFQRLVDRGVQRDSTLQLVLQNIVGMKIFVKLPSRQGSIEIEAKAQDTIRNVKDMILAKKMIQLDQFSLVYDGQLLEEDSTLASLDIKNESILCMIPATKDFLSVYVKPPSGETFKLKVRTLFTVSDVKTMVGSIKGVSFGEQNLIYYGNVLEDLKTLAFYDIKDESVIEISPRPFQIFVKVSAGKTITINATQCDTVEDVKVKVFHKLNVSTKPIDFYPLLFDGKRLDKGRDLASYNIQKDSTLVLVLYPSSSMV